MLLNLVGFTDRKDNSFQRPFLAEARTRDGTLVDVWVKPRIKGDPLSGHRLLAEWAGYCVLEQLKLPTPERFLVSVSRSFIDSAKGRLSDVVPGLAFACRMVDNPVPVAILEPDEISNHADAAGITVADTVIANDDRHGENALVSVIDPDGPNKMWFIDNTRVLEREEDVPLPGNVVGCLPSDPTLKKLVKSEEDFGPFLLFAESMGEADVTAGVKIAPHELWAGVLGLPTDLAQQLMVRAGSCREAVLRDIRAFPELAR